MNDELAMSDVERLERELRYPILPKIFFWIDAIINAIIIRLALMDGADESDPKIILLLLPVIATIFCLNRAIPFAEYLGYLRIPYVLFFVFSWGWEGIGNGTTPALIGTGIVIVWHILYGLCVRSYQLSKQKLHAFQSMVSLMESEEKDE